MPRFRFQWSNIEASILQSLTVDLKLADNGDAAQTLRAQYGAKPKEEFIKDAWNTLLEKWLVNDLAFASAVADAVRKSGLGDSSVTDDLDFLRSCRNTIGLRREVLKAFLAFGEQGVLNPAIAGLVPTHSSSTQSEPRQGLPISGNEMITASDDSLLENIKEAVSRLYSIEPDDVLVDSDGDVVLPNGSSVAFIRISSEPVSIRLFAILLSDVSESADLFSTINEVNANIFAGFLYYQNNRVYLQHTVLAAGGLSVQTLIQTIDCITDLADFFDDKLQERFGGEKFRAGRADDEIEV
jgi:hypothetical protein